MHRPGKKAALALVVAFAAMPGAMLGQSQAAVAGNAAVAGESTAVGVGAGGAGVAVRGLVAGKTVAGAIDRRETVDTAASTTPQMN
jgi:hypothetical protein